MPALAVKLFLDGTCWLCYLRRVEVKPVAAERKKVTVRLGRDLYDRLKAYEKASGGVPQNKLLCDILEKALPKKPVRR